MANFGGKVFLMALTKKGENYLKFLLAVKPFRDFAI